MTDDVSHKDIYERLRFMNDRLDYEHTSNAEAHHKIEERLLNIEKVFGMLKNGGAILIFSVLISGNVPEWVVEVFSKFIK